jgi:rhodanese-related sulfurtransferase
VSSSKRIKLAEARQHVDNGEALLVCAHPDAETCNEYHLEGSMTLAELEEEITSLSSSQEIVFYCASPEQKVSSHVATEYRDKGFENARVLEGGAKAWTEAAESYR